MIRSYHRPWKTKSHGIQVVERRVLDLNLTTTSRTPFAIHQSVFDHLRSCVPSGFVFFCCFQVKPYARHLKESVLVRR